MRAHRLVFFVVVFVDDILRDVAALWLSSLPHPTAPVSVVDNSTKLDDIAGISHGHAELEDEERGLAEAVDKLWGLVSVRDLNPLYARFRPGIYADFVKKQRSLEYGKWLKKSGIRPAWNGETIAGMFEQFRESRIDKFRKNSVDHDLPDFFHWLRHEPDMQTVADRCQLMLYKDESLRESVTLVWLRIKMHPKDVLTIFREWNGGASAWLRYILQYRMLKDVPVFTDEEALTVLLQTRWCNVGLTCGHISETMRYQPLQELAESMQMLFFDRLIAKRVRPAAYSKTIGMFNTAIIDSPVFSAEFSAFKRFILQCADILGGGMRAEADAAFGKKGKYELMLFLQKMDEG